MSTEQAVLVDSIRTFCAREYSFSQRRAVLSGPDGFSRGHWATFAELGWLGAGLPEKLGGYGGGAVENALIAEQFGRSLVAEPFVASAVLVQQVLAACPSTPLRDDLLAACSAGEQVFALAHGELAARGNVDHVETEAARMGDAWRLNGRKSLALNAMAADRLLVSARSADGVGLFVVDPRARGVTIKGYRLLDNSRAADIWLDEVAVDAILAPPGRAEGALALGYAHATTALCADAVGAMSAAIDLTRDYVRTRSQFGSRLGEFQAVQHRMADMLVELELSRSMVFQGLACLAQAEADLGRGISAMKAITSSAAMFVGRNAIQLHGAIGMTEEYPVGHYYRRLFVTASMFGNEAHHLARMSTAA